jgi:precorrin-6B methylase 2
MVEWLDLRPGDHILEPSAGHGAIARWLPQTTSNTLIEPSVELASELALTSEGNRSNVRVMTFEDLDVGANKFDGIVMNPPFGTGGKTAMEHLAKAWNHLNDSGRLVAIIPNGPSMDKRFDKWLEETEGVVVSAQFTLPTVTFDRAGTGVSTRVLILDKHLSTIRGGVDVSVGTRVTVIGGKTVGLVSMVYGDDIAIKSAEGSTVWAKRANVVKADEKGQPLPHYVDNKRAMEAASRARQPRTIEAATAAELFEKLEDIGVPERRRPEGEAAARPEPGRVDPRGTTLEARGLKVEMREHPTAGKEWFVSGKGTFQHKTVLRRLGGAWVARRKEWMFSMDPTKDLRASLGLDGEPNGFDEGPNLECD